jgi:hypothetical protein
MRHLLVALLAVLMLLGCTEKQPRSVADFMENEAALYGALARCEQQPGAGADPECANARQAAERIAVIQERAMRKAREQAFESAREEYRARLDRERELRRRAEAEAEAARLQALLGPEIDAGDAAETEDFGGLPGPAEAGELDAPVPPEDGAGDTG